MKLLAYSDWKQKIAFDNIIYKDTKRFSLMLNSAEREILDAEINFYRNHFSLLQVMDHFKYLKTKKEKEIFIKAVLKRTEKILYIPYMIKNFYKKKIKEEFSEYTNFFTLLLEKAENQSPINPMINLYKTILGRYYKAVVKKVNKRAKEKDLRIVQKQLNIFSYENNARKLIYDLQFDLNLATIFGRSSIRKTVPISIVDEYGYGEWKSKNISYGANRFFLYSNHNKLTDKQLEHMVYFNIYPGQAHFYNTIVDKGSNIAFDSGATFLINGWAMYAMCKCKNSAYANSILTEGSIIAHHLLKKNLEKSYENVWVYLLGKYTKAQAIRYMIDYTQYPGHYLSYILGETAIEMCLHNGFAHTPIEFLNALSQVDCGDFFAIYHPKVQKKLLKTHITAKVAHKFHK